MLAFKLALSTVLGTGVVFWFSRNIGTAFFQSRRYLLIGITSLVVSLFWLGYESTRLTYSVATRDWDKIPGLVVKSRVAGKRAVHPEITIRYRIDDLARTFTTDLFAPGFGVRSNRRDQAEKLVAEYSPGDTVFIHVNPHNLLQARLNVGPTWDIFVRLALSIFVLIFGVWLILGFIWSIRENAELSTGDGVEK